ncbi:MAG: benzoyl-CoA reductase subunit D [Deltaproteobacteria bacterium]|nr:benzoyl-CoA reductase subunit D [Deltaproteobacteria bacterium]
MSITAGIDVGTGAIKAVVMKVGGGKEELLSQVSARIRKREIHAVVEEVFQAAVRESAVKTIDYIATTGDAEDVPFASGHFYGMTTHARGAIFLDPKATAVLDVGALHGRAVKMDARGRVLNYKMTSQCASGSGQFLENIARYLGVSQAEVGMLSKQAQTPEKVSSICAVLAETDVINMVSRGISTPDILRGIHESMAGRFARLLRSLDVEGVVLVTGGLASDEGLIAATQDALDSDKKAAAQPVKVEGHALSIFAGAIGAAIWGAYRLEKVTLDGPAWQAAA